MTLTRIVPSGDANSVIYQYRIILWKAHRGETEEETIPMREWGKRDIFKSLLPKGHSWEPFRKTVSVSWCVTIRSKEGVLEEETFGAAQEPKRQNGTATQTPHWMSWGWQGDFIELRTYHCDAQAVLDCLKKNERKWMRKGMEFPFLPTGDLKAPWLKHISKSHFA